MISLIIKMRGIFISLLGRTWILIQLSDYGHKIEIIQAEDNPEKLLKRNLYLYRFLLRNMNQKMITHGLLIYQEVFVRKIQF